MIRRSFESELREVKGRRALNLMAAGWRMVHPVVRGYKHPGDSCRAELPDLGVLLWPTKSSACPAELRVAAEKGLTVSRCSEPVGHRGRHHAERFGVEYFWSES